MTLAFMNIKICNKTEEQSDANFYINVYLGWSYVHSVN